MSLGERVHCVCHPLAPSNKLIAIHLALTRVLAIAPRALAHRPSDIKHDYPLPLSQVALLSRALPFTSLGDLSCPGNLCKNYRSLSLSHFLSHKPLSSFAHFINSLLTSLVSSHAEHAFAYNGDQRNFDYDH